MGDGADITLSAERKLGDRIARELFRDPDYLEDPVLDEYLQNIWQPLVKGAQARGELSPELQERFAWRVLIGRDRSVNAFALPGGYLGIHLGLISVVTTRDELASDMAHELSHVTQRHISRSMGEQARMTPWLIGAMILGMLAEDKQPTAVIRNLALYSLPFSVFTCQRCVASSKWACDIRVSSSISERSWSLSETKFK